MKLLDKLRWSQRSEKFILTAFSADCIIGVMPDRSSIKPVDLNQLAKSIVDEATDEAIADRLQAKALAEGKNPAAVMLGRLGGLKGGKARAVKLTAQERSAIAKRAAQARWQKQ